MYRVVPFKHPLSTRKLFGSEPRRTRLPPPVRSRRRVQNKPNEEFLIVRIPIPGHPQQKPTNGPSSVRIIELENPQAWIFEPGGSPRVRPRRSRRIAKISGTD